MGRVVIMRGLTGSGKTTIAKYHFPEALFLSVDDFFMVEGKYVFNSTMLETYHKRILRTYVENLMQGTPFIVIDNTNLRQFEISPYYRLGEAMDYDVEILWVMARPDICKKRNTRGMPGSVIDGMFARTESIPYWWRIHVITN